MLQKLLFWFWVFFYYKGHRYVCDDYIISLFIIAFGYLHKDSSQLETKRNISFRGPVHNTKKKRNKKIYE